MKDTVIMVPYGTRLGFHVNGVAATLANIDYKFPQCVCYEENTQTDMKTNSTSAVCFAIENHPNDSRCRIDPDGIVQTLSSRMGTGGNNTPFVLMKAVQEDPVVPVCAVASTCVNAEITNGSISPTIMARAGTGGNQLPLVVLKKVNK